IMKLTSQLASPADVKADWLVVGVWEDEPLSGAAAALDAKLGGALGRLREAGDIAGKAKETTPLLNPSGIAAARVLAVGLGPRAKADRAVLVDAAAAAARRITGKQYPRVAMLLPDSYPNLGWDEVAEKAGLGLQQGSVGPGLRKNKPERF